MPWKRSLEFFSEALFAIDHAHKQGIIHRDIKPANMMVDGRDILKVLDFGIVRVLGSTRLTRTGLAIGTLKYMPPEQIRGQEIDARSDLYSLGIVLYEMLTGRVPFMAAGEFDLMRAQIEETPTPVRELAEDVPEDIEEAVLRALTKDPDVAELGFTYTHGMDSLPVEVPLSAATVYAGYRYQAFETEIPGGEDRSDTTRGFVAGVNLTF
ncbi:MAG: serine/threonine protein kinase [Gammaproteobacteria bacterium]